MLWKILKPLLCGAAFGMMLIWLLLILMRWLARSAS
jgi:hypothetical protein